MPPSRCHRRAPARTPAVVAAVLLVVLLAAGCGGSSSKKEGPTGLASVVPSAAPLYAEGTVHPSAGQRTAAAAAARRVTGAADPFPALAREVDMALGATSTGRGGPDLRSWLGDAVGATVTGFRSPRHPEFAVLAESKDDARAAAFLHARVAGGAVRRRTYRGVEELVAGTGPAPVAGIVDHVVVIGTERAFRAIVDTAKGDASLAASAPFTKERDAAPADRLGFVYLSPAAAVDALAISDSSLGALAAPVKAALSGAGAGTIAAALSAAPDALVLDAATTGGGRTVPAGASVAGAPAGSDAAVSLANVGSTLRGAIRGLGAVTVPGVGSLREALAQVSALTGIDVDRDLLSWMGPGTLWARTGGNVPEVALVVDSSDPAATRSALDRLGILLAPIGLEATTLQRPGVDSGLRVTGRGLPAPLFLAAAGDRFIVALGDGALTRALHPGRRLAADPGFRAARARLGAGVTPSAYADLPRLLGYAGRQVGSVRGAQAAASLHALSTLVAGVRRDGATARLRAVVTLR